MHVSETVTGIPSDILWLALGTLITWIYWDLRRELRSLRGEARDRKGMLSDLILNVRLVCQKLNMKFIVQTREDSNRD